MRFLLSLLSGGVLMAALAGCGSDAAPADAASDGGVDAAADARPDAPSDTGPACDAACGPSARCCASADAGLAMCVNPIDDPNHCGGCGIACAAGRGTHCANSRCVCGFSDMGCSGTSASTCCPSEFDGGMAYCADFSRDSTDCGACGAACDLAQADRCDGARCRCGTGRNACAGTPADLCCADVGGLVECVDSLTDVRHCGGCTQRCQFGEACRDGVCARGTTLCTAACVAGEICCDGVCCSRSLCDIGACAAPDAGP